MLDHFSIAVSNYSKSREFYDKTLAVLGYERIVNIDVPEENIIGAGYGKDGKPYFWMGLAKNNNEEIGKARGVHLAFVAQNEQAVKDWYQKCLELGGKDNGSPGPRAEYHPGYFGAFIIDPDGWRIEACFHGFQG